MPPTILKSYRRAAETFPASEKGWHGSARTQVVAPQGACRGLGLSMGVRPAFLPYPSVALIRNSIPPPPWPTWVS